MPTDIERLINVKVTVRDRVTVYDSKQRGGTETDFPLTAKPSEVARFVEQSMLQLVANAARQFPLAKPEPEPERTVAEVAEDGDDLDF